MKASATCAWIEGVVPIMHGNASCQMSLGRVVESQLLVVRGKGKDLIATGTYRVFLDWCRQAENGNRARWLFERRIREVRPA